MRVFLFLFEVFADGYAGAFVPTARADSPLVWVEDEFFITVVDLTGNHFELYAAGAAALKHAFCLHVTYHSTVVGLRGLSGLDLRNLLEDEGSGLDTIVFV